MNENNRVPVLVPPQFAKFMAEFFGDKRGVLWPVANISRRQFELDVAQTSHEVAVEGDFIYADPETTGTMYVQFNDPAMPWIPIKTNMSISGFPIRRIFAKWDAQPGLVVNLLYGYGAQIIPPNQEIASISSGIDGIMGDKITTDLQAFTKGAQLVGGNNPMLQLRNPVGSGIVIYLDKIRAASTVTGLITAFRNLGTGTGGVGAGMNKDLVQYLDPVTFGDSKALIDTDNPLGASNPIVRFFGGLVLANTLLEHKFEPALRIMPDIAVAVQAPSTATLHATFEWREKSL